MLSLLLTLFISLFSIGAPINSVEDPKENIVYVNECKPISQSYIIEDSQGVVTYFTKMDLMNGDLWRTFIESLPLGLRMGYTEPTLNSYTFTGLGSSVWATTNEVHQGSGIFSINQLVITKSSIDPYTYQGIDYTKQVYSMQFKDVTSNHNYNVFLITLTFAVPYVTTNDQSIGIQCTDIVYTSQNAGNGNILYIENNKNGGFNPLTTYGYYPYHDLFGDTNSYNAGYNYGYSQGYNSGVDAGYDSGYSRGYTDGLNAYDGYDTVASSIFSGIFDVGLLPVNVFLTIFNFELFGVNIAGIVSGLLTLSVVIIILRLLLGGKKDD